jgi:hypothetical protein
MDVLTKKIQRKRLASKLFSKGEAPFRFGEELFIPFIRYKRTTKKLRSVRYLG